MKRPFALFVTPALLIIFLDQVLKAWTRNAANHTEHRSISTVIPDVLDLKLVYNEGIAFGLFQGSAIWMTPIAVAIAILAGVTSFRKPEEGAWLHVTMSLLAGGAVGNLIDRLAFGKVTDMFWVRIIDFPVFNIADIAITAAGVMLVIGAARDLIESAHRDPQAEPEPTDPADAELEPQPSEPDSPASS